MTGPDPQARFQLKRLWVPIFMMAGISILSGSAGIQTHGWSFVGMDKLGHLVVFGLLGVAWARCLSMEASSAAYRILFATGLSTVFGYADELHQFHNPARTFEWADLAADFLGALSGSVLYVGSGGLRALLESRIKDLLRLPSRKKPSN